MDSSEIAALETELTGTDEEVSDTFTVATVSDTGKLADTLSDEEKGNLISKLKLHQQVLLQRLVPKMLQLVNKLKLRD